MREVVSSILKLGLVNSGMFDTLELATDVRAVHLVGDNNVGKTSLIECMQFLFFPDLRDMHFSKGLSETLAFYFRREGSYIVFSVRTVRGTIRTLAIYGTGTADSRQVMVFDGVFDLATLLDDQQHVRPPQQLGVALADRRFHLFRRVEEHEQALVGEHSVDQANIQLFDLTRGNARLLRQLLQNLLRLERLSVRDIRQFLNALVLSTGAKVRIDVAQDFDRKYAETRAIRNRIAQLTQLQPLLVAWTAARTRLDASTAAEARATQRLFWAATRYAAALDDERATLLAQATSVRQTLLQCDAERQQRADAQAATRSSIAAHERTRITLGRLRARCADQTADTVRTTRDHVSYQAIALQSRLDAAATASVDQVERRVRAARADLTRLQRQHDQRTVDDLLADADDDTRALVHFVFGEPIRSLPVAAVTDPEALQATVRALAAHVDADGVLRAAGLAVTRTTWWRATDDELPLAERLAQATQTLQAAEDDLAIAQDRAQVTAQIRALQHRVSDLDEVLLAFRQLAELVQQHGDETDLADSIATAHAALAQHQADSTALATTIQTQQDTLIRINSTLRETEQRAQEVRLVEVGAHDGACPDDIAATPAHALAEEFRRCRDQQRDQRSERRRAEEAYRDPDTRLQERYERDAPTVPFAVWVDEQHQLTTQIDRLEDQLRASYVNLVALVKGELDKLTHAFDVVRGRVAELNQMVRRVSISNIAQIALQVQESELVEAIRQTSQLQIDMFAAPNATLSLAQAEQQIEQYLIGTLRAHGRELRLDDLFQLQFQVTYAETGEQRTVSEIHAFESNGTAIGVKIVVYLGLIRLLQGNRRGVLTRIPFFLDEVGSLSSNNVRQLIDYCTEHHFLPIFASPTIRADIPHSYILQRSGDRSRLVNEVILTERDDATTALD